MVRLSKKFACAIVFAGLCLLAASEAAAQNECAILNPSYQTMVYTRDSNDVLHQTLCQDPVTGKEYASSWFVGNAGAGVAFSTITSGQNTQAAMQVSSTTASLSPLNSGQVASNQLWIPQALLVPSTTGTLTGGTILASHNWQIQYTLNTLAGETTASVLLSGPTQNLAAACTSGGSCTLTINDPRPLLAGYTTWNLYACDTSGGGPCTSPQKIPACTAIIGNCTLTGQQTANSSAPPTLNTAWLQPANMQGTAIVDSGSLFAASFPTTDGNYHGWLTLDTQSCDNTTGPSCPGGTPVFFGRTWFTNLTSNPVQYPSFPQAFKNSMMSINTDISLSGITTTNQSRALGIMVQNPISDNSTNRYSMQGIQVENDINGAPNWSGAPDGEVAAGSFQISDQHTGGNIGGMGNWTIRSQYFRQAGAATYGSCTATPCFGAGKFIFTNSSSVAGAGAVAAALRVQATDATNGDALAGIALWIDPPGTNSRFGTRNWGIYMPSYNNGFINAGRDAAFKFDWANATTPYKGVFQTVLFLGGGLYTSGCPATYCPSFASNLLNGAGTAGVAGPTTSIPIWGSLQPNAGISTNQLVGATFTTDFQCNVTGATGTNYSYSVVAVDGTGFGTTAASSACIASAAATLNGTNFVTITMLNPQGGIYGTGAVRYDAYRTASSGTPSSTGFIGSLSCAQSDVELFIDTNVTICSIQDQGTPATGIVPVVNTTGGIAAKGDYFFTRDKGQHFNPQAANNDFAGTCTAAAATTCTVTFTRAYSVAPVCVATDQTNITVLKVTPSTASLVITTSAASSDVFAYHCVGNPN